MTNTSEVFIAATETDPSVRAQTAFKLVGQELLHTVRAETVRAYLDAADRTLYAAAAGAAETRLLVRGLRVTAGLLDGRIAALPRTDEPTAASDVSEASDAAAVAAFEAALAAHLAVEHEVLLPALAVLPGADVPALVEDFETLRTGGKLEAPDELDVREIPHGQRHPRIFARFTRLSPGQGFTLVNNHDPKPLRREFQATYPDAFTWDYLESGPELWRVRIGREAVDAA